MLSRSTPIRLIPIRNMNRALRFYTNTLGGRMRLRGRGEMRDAWAWVKIGKADFWLIQPEKRERMDLAYNAFLVRDIRKTVAGLKRRGASFLPAESMGPGTKIDGPIATMPWGDKSAFFKDSEGNLLMLWEQAPG